MGDRFEPGDLVEVRYPRDKARTSELNRGRKGPLIGSVIGRMTEQDEPEVYWVGFESAASRRMAADFGEDNPYYDENDFFAGELVLHSRRRRPEVNRL